MRIALIADTHGMLDTRIAEAVAGADVLVHAGDVGNDVVAAMTPLSERLVIVHGNNDPQDSGWPQSETLDLPGGQLVVIHGHQWPAKTRHRKLREQFPDAGAVVCGHSHRRVIDQDVEPWVLNPGAAGRTRAYGGPGWLELIAGTDEWQVRGHDLAPMKNKRR
ncbi:metallophosphoesterase family protein [Salinisphaera dokdonensis]|uniref:metallophosphoesterase family protein n=1 Tax=Salinisphaera dokdonensis TaxID=454598 RepID=UPI0033404EA9